MQIHKIILYSPQQKRRMNETTRRIKEESYLDAAENVFSKFGFQNTKMEDIAEKAGCSKPTLYNYFSSKENLYMAITYRAFERLLDFLHRAIKENAENPGMESAIHAFWAYQEFSEQHFFYHQLLLEHLDLVRSISNQREHPWLTDAMEKSLYFQKVKSIQNVPVSMCVEQIHRGQQDGSIKNSRNPIEIYLTAWAFVIGFTKINGLASGTLHQYPMGEWKNHVYDQVEAYLKNGGL